MHGVCKHFKKHMCHETWHCVVQLSRKREILISKGIWKTDVNHVYVRVSRDATREGSNTAARENGFHGAMSNTVLRKMQTHMIDYKRLTFVLLSGRIDISTYRRVALNLKFSIGHAPYLWRWLSTMYPHTIMMVRRVTLRQILRVPAAQSPHILVARIRTRVVVESTMCLFARHVAVHQSSIS